MENIIRKCIVIECEIFTYIFKIAKKKENFCNCSKNVINPVQEKCLYVIRISVKNILYILEGIGSKFLSQTKICKKIDKLKLCV